MLLLITLNTILYNFCFTETAFCFPPKDAYKLLKGNNFVICVLVTLASGEPISDLWRR